MTEILLSTFNVTRSEKIRWRLSWKPGEDLLSVIPSKSVRAFFAHTDEVLDRNGLTVEYGPLSASNYLVWLEFYKQKIEAHHYHQIATEEWWQQKLDEGKIVEQLSIFKEGRMVSSGIIVRVDTQLATLAFSASERINLSGRSNSSLGALLNFLYFLEMEKRGVQTISGGRSRNAFGVENTLGYLEYKLRNGYVPSHDEASGVLDQVAVNDDGYVLFYGWRDSVFTQFSLSVSSHPFVFESGRWGTRTVPYEALIYTVAE